MDKRLALLGILLGLAGFAIATASYNPASVVYSPKSSIIIAPNSISYTTVKLNQTSLLSLIFSSKPSPVDFYLLNQSGFTLFERYFASSSITSNAVSALEGKGLLLYIKNSTGGVFPYNSTYSEIGFRQPSYTYNLSASTPFYNGTYYLVYKNLGSNSTNASFEYAIPNTGLLLDSSSSAILGPASTVSAFLVLAGMVLFILSFIRPGKEPKTAKEKEEEILLFYDKLSKKKSNGTSRRKPGHKGQ